MENSLIILFLKQIDITLLIQERLLANCER